MKLRLAHLAAPLATLAVVAATASPAGATLAPSNRAPATQRDVPKTTITLHVTTCRRCPARLTHVQGNEQRRSRTTGPSGSTQDLGKGHRSSVQDSRDLWSSHHVGPPPPSTEP